VTYLQDVTDNLNFLQ